MKTMSVKKAIKKGYLVKWDGGEEYTSYEEKKNVAIRYKGNSINCVEVYHDGGDYKCCISVPVGKDHLDEHLFKTLKAKVDVYI